MNKIKPKKCRICKKLFNPLRALQRVCGYDCSITYAKVLADKNKASRALKMRRETKQKLDKLKSKSDWLKETQIVYNLFIRIRDFGLNCISCDKPMYKKINAGHYRSVKAAPHLRFDERNTFAQCEHCNMHLSGNIVNYRPNIIKRVGIAQVEAVESDNTPKHYTIDDIKELKLFYKAKIKELQND